MDGFRLIDGLTLGMERVLDLRSAQHLLTAGNLANADTPGYLAQEIPFDELLSDVVRAAERGDQGPEGEVRSLEAPPGTLDGNSVSPEREAVRMTSNSLMFDTVSTGISRRLAMLKFAATDGRA
ncbi:MAG: hypothetical protein Q8P18_13905 [Pseudomonadota bacterium]|nr:hypothetical protein [Pseudomonadota bacterium]